MIIDMFKCNVNEDIDATRTCLTFCLQFSTLLANSSLRSSESASLSVRDRWPVLRAESDSCCAFGSRCLNPESILSKPMAVVVHRLCSSGPQPTRGGYYQRGLTTYRAGVSIYAPNKSKYPSCRRNLSNLLYRALTHTASTN